MSIQQWGRNQQDSKFGPLEWSDRPPSVSHPVPGYLESIKVVNTAFRASFKSRDDARYLYRSLWIHHYRLYHHQSHHPPIRHLRKKYATCSFWTPTFVLRPSTFFRLFLLKSKKKDQQGDLRNKLDKTHTGVVVFGTSSGDAGCRHGKLLLQCYSEHVYPLSSIYDVVANVRTLVFHC